jgi:DNA-binding Xre family transcriptional regulator
LWYSPPMITVTIREMAEKRGYQTAYALQKAMNVPPSMAARLWSNELKMIGMDTLDRLCTTLECEPNDVLRFKAKKGSKK